MKSNKSLKREVNVTKFILNVLGRGTLNREAQIRVLTRALSLVVGRGER